MSTTFQPISAIVLTLNEEKNISEILENLHFVDEIILVDSCSTDRTKFLALQNNKVRFFERPFDNFASQRNFAISKTKNNWILVLDADERISNSLIREIVETVASKNACSAYLVYRKFIFEGKQLHFSGWQTDKIYRLFQKDKASYLPKKLVHEKLVVNGSIGILRHKLRHYSYYHFESYRQKMILYGKLKAKEEFEKGKKPNIYHFYIRPLYKFLYQYLIRLGFLDGKKGITICYLNALSDYHRFQELKILHQKIIFSKT